MIVHITLDHGVMDNWVSVLTRQGGMQQLQTIPTDRPLDFSQRDSILHQHPQRFAVSGVTGF